MGTSNGNKSTLAGLAAHLAAGAQNHYPAGSSLPVGGALLTLVQIVAYLTEIATLRADVETARAALRAKVAAETLRMVALRVFLSAFVRIVRGSFGNQPDVLADFGLAPNKVRTPPTATQVAAAVAKRKATRAARGTKGSKALMGIHGDVVGVVVTPVTAAQPAVSDASSGSTGATGATTPATPHS